MPSAPIIAALALPSGSLVDQRVPKKLLIEQGTPAAGDKKQVQDGLEELVWHAALKPTNIGVPAFTDATRDYLEIAVLVATLRPLAKRARLVELIHRAIPYLVLLITRQAECATVSLAHKRRSQGEAGKVVLDDAVVTTEPLWLKGRGEEETWRRGEEGTRGRGDSNPISSSPRPLFPFSSESSPHLLVSSSPHLPTFLAGLSVTAQPSAHLYALYHGWLARVTGLLAAGITGRVDGVAEPIGGYEARRAALAEHGRLSAELAGLRATAAKEKQLNRRVELNLAVRRLESQLAAISLHL